MAKVDTSAGTIDRLLSGVEDVLVRESLLKKLKSGKKLRIKHGVDPTTTDLHLGYAVIYEKLRQFQEAGHTIVFLIGDYTARFGDPSDRDSMRVMKSKKEVMALAKNYIKQVGVVLDIAKTEVRYNGDWYDAMSAEQLLHLISRFTHAQMIQRDMFQRRLADHAEIGLHELIYPILQGYDSVMLESDLTVCGSDQLFNEMQGRKLQEAYGQKPQDIMMMPLLIGTDGTQKMSQSLGNYIGLNESAQDMFGKIMSIPDTLMVQYYRLLTRYPDSDILGIVEAIERKQDARELKFQLAQHITSNYHGDKKAKKAGEQFNAIFRDKERPQDMPRVAYEKTPTSIIELIHGLSLAASKGEARRLVEQGGVSIDEVKITDPKTIITPVKGMVIQVGKRTFVRIS